MVSWGVACGRGNGDGLPGHLGENLHEGCVEETGAPLLDLEHDEPAGGGDGLLCFDGGLDLVELRLDVFLVPAVVVESVEDLQGFIGAICLDEIARRLREEHDTGDDDQTWDTLESKRESPREGTRLGYMGRTIAHPGGNDETNANHLLGDTDNQT